MSTNSQAIDNIIEQISAGATLREMRGVSQEEIEAIYAMAYNFYNCDKYEESHVLFQYLSIFDHLNRKHWLGLGASRQMMQDYKGAVDAYSMAAFLEMEDPVAPFQAGECHLAMGNRKEAESAFRYAIEFASTKPQHANLRQRAEGLLSLLLASNQESSSTNTQQKGE